MLKITDENFDHYKQIAEVIWQFQAQLLKLDPNVGYSPVNVLNSWEKKSKSLARKGLREGLRDALTMLIDLPLSMKTELDEKLANKSLPSFNHLVSSIKDVPAKCLKRKKIKSLDEYYVIKEIVNDLTYDINEIDRAELEKLYHDFENK